MNGYYWAAVLVFSIIVIQIALYPHIEDLLTPIEINPQLQFFAVDPDFTSPKYPPSIIIMKDGCNMTNDTQELWTFDCECLWPEDCEELKKMKPE